MTNASTSFDLFGRSGLVGSVLFIFAALIVGSAISFGLIPDTWLPAEWQEGALAIALCLLFLFFVITPIRLWFLNQAKINRLENRLKPCLSVEFDKNNPHFQATDPKHAREHAKRTFRIRLENRGSESLAHCYVKLDALIDRTNSRSSEVDLKFRFHSDGGDSCMLGPGASAYVDIVEMDENDPAGLFQLCYAIPSSRTNVVNRVPKIRGPHKLVLKVIGGPEPVTKTYKIAVDPHGFLTMEEGLKAMGEPQSEYVTFTNLVDKLLKGQHKELKAKLDAEKRAKKPKPEGPSASRV